MTQNDLIDHIIIPRTGDIGNFEVYRALPSRERQMVGPFIFWDQMGPGEFLTDQGVDVRPHPHIGLATMTYLFSGTLDHKDSLGYDQRIEPGAVNLMTAGSGIVHSERTGQDIRQQPSNLFGIQSWLALPKDQEERDPAFAHTPEDTIPILEDEGKKVNVVMGAAYGLTSSVMSYSDTLYLNVRMKAGETLPLPRETEERAIYPLSGRIQIGDTIYDPMQLLILHPGKEVTVRAETDAHFVVCGGAAMDGPRHIWWNFVSSSQGRIEQAKQDWQSGRFDMVKSDPEFIPLPEN